MRINPYPDRDKIDQLVECDLRALLDQPSDKEQRPCPDCHVTCKCARHSTLCCCGCSSLCPDAPAYLSSDPVRYPIEAKVVPLVYALTTMRLTPPCWSCEGHLSKNEKLLRPPQVWFYSAGTAYPQLISSYLETLTFRKVLTYSWEVAVNPHTDDGTTIFVIKPDTMRLPDIHLPELIQLQQDMAYIAESLVAEIHGAAKAKLAALHRGNTGGRTAA